MSEPAAALRVAAAFAVLQLGSGLAACEPAPSSRGTSLVTPAPDVDGAFCADVGGIRVCWPADGPPRIVERTVPPGLDPTRVRCAGSGATRRCELRLARATPFRCEGDVCVQWRPRQPDDGEWACSEIAGVARCVKRAEGTGFVAGPPEPGWLCGERVPGKEVPASFAKPGPVCVDLSPDRPEGPGPWRCRFDGQRNGARVCERIATAVPAAGDACADGGACPKGATCAGGRCVPPVPQPACWFDQDCPSGACLFGSCAR